MNYQDALREWGAQQIEAARPGTLILRNTVNVSMDFDEGYACCGGSRDGCYCSMATSPTAEVNIQAYDVHNNYVNYRIDADCFDFVTVLGQIVEAGGGVLND